MSSRRCTQCWRVLPLARFVGDRGVQGARAVQGARHGACALEAERSVTPRDLATAVWYGAWYVVFGTLSQMQDARVRWGRRRAAWRVA